MAWVLFTIGSTLSSVAVGAAIGPVGFVATAACWFLVAAFLTAIIRSI